MANLGKLWFELGLKDRTDKDIEVIRKKVEKRLKELGVEEDNSGLVRPEKGECGDQY